MRRRSPRAGETIRRTRPPGCTWPRRASSRLDPAQRPRGALVIGRSRPHCARYSSATLTKLLPPPGMPRVPARGRHREATLALRVEPASLVQVRCAAISSSRCGDEVVLAGPARLPPRSASRSATASRSIRVAGTLRTTSAVSFAPRRARAASSTRPAWAASPTPAEAPPRVLTRAAIHLSATIRRQMRRPPRRRVQASALLGPALRRGGPPRARPASRPFAAATRGRAPGRRARANACRLAARSARDRATARLKRASGSPGSSSAACVAGLDRADEVLRLPQLPATRQVGGREVRSGVARPGVRHRRSTQRPTASSQRRSNRRRTPSVARRSGVGERCEASPIRAATRSSAGPARRQGRSAIASNGARRSPPVRRPSPGVPAGHARPAPAAEKEGPAPGPGHLRPRRLPKREKPRR